MSTIKKTGTYELKSVDVWDTLLRRRSHHSKLYTSQFIILNFKRYLDASYPNKWSIYYERLGIEREIHEARERSGLDGEYDIFEVFNNLVWHIFHMPLDRDVKSIVNELVETEVLFEISNTYIDPNIKETLAKYPSKKTIFLSDFYMPKKVLSRILSHHGMLEYFKDGGIVSCDVFLNKRSGRLFKHVHDLFSIEPFQHIHIGDNRYADHNIPSSLGIKSIHYVPLNENRKKIRNEKLFGSRELFTEILAEINKKTKDQRLACKNMEAFRFGVQVAPLFVGYSLFILEKIIQGSLDKVFFMTREGEFFIKVFKTLFSKKKSFNISVPHVQILEVSRQSTFCASLSEVSTKEIMRIWVQYSTQSIKALCKSLNISVDTILKSLSKYGIHPDEEIIYPWKDIRVKQLFASRDFQKAIYSVRPTSKKNLVNYFDQICKVRPERVGLVDIGWRGTIQDNLAYVFPDIEFTGLYLGLLNFLNPQPPNALKLVYLLDLNKNAANAKLFKNVSAFEIICTSPNGSVIGYESQGQTIKAQRQVIDKENEIFYRYTQYLQEGILAATKVWSTYIESHVIISDDIYQDSIQILKLLSKELPFKLINTYASLQDNQMFGRGQFDNLRVVPSIRSLIKAVFSMGSSHDVTNNFLLRAPYARNILKRNDINIFKKAFWVNIYFLISIYKKIRGIKLKKLSKPRMV